MSVASEGSSRSKRRVALATSRKLKTLFGGASGGMQGGPKCWRRHHDRKSGAGRGFAAPSATDIRAFPPGGKAVDGGPNPRSGFGIRLSGAAP